MNLIKDLEKNIDFCTDPRAYEVVEQFASSNFCHFINKQPIDVKNIVVVGAYHGDEIYFYLNHYPNSTIYAFEPHPVHYNVLYDRFKQNSRVKTYNLAASNENNNQKAFYVTDAEGNSSLLRFQGHELGHPMKVVDKIYVNCTRIDRMVELCNKEIDLIQIDVQGAEKFVLFGLQHILHNINSFILETHTHQFEKPWDEEPYKGQTYLEDFVSFFEKTGIEAHSVGLDNEHHNGQGNSFWYRK